MEYCLSKLFTYPDELGLGLGLGLESCIKCPHGVYIALGHEYRLPSEYSLPSPGVSIALTWSMKCPQSIVCPHVEYRMPSPKMVPFFKVS